MILSSAADERSDTCLSSWLQAGSVRARVAPPDSPVATSPSASRNLRSAPLSLHSHSCLKPNRSSRTLRSDLAQPDAAVKSP
jgi:hypothetical protein